MYQNQYSPLNYFYVIAIIFVLLASLKAGYHGLCTKTKLSTIKRIFLLRAKICLLRISVQPIFACF